MAGLHRRRLPHRSNSTTVLVREGVQPERTCDMSAQPNSANSPSVAYHAAERAVLRAVALRSLTALEQMYAYFGTDRA
jgi:hypothetical protein